jgi:integrase
MASLERRGKKPNRWLIRWYQDGRQHKQRFDGTYQAAMQRKAEIEADKWKPAPPPGQPVLDRAIGPWVMAYLAGRPGGEPSWVTNRNRLWPFIHEYGEMQFSELTIDHLRHYVDVQRKSGNRRTGEPLSPRTLFDRLSHLQRALKTAAREGLITRELADGIEPGRQRRSFHDTLTDRELGLWMRLAQGSIEEVPLGLGGGAGLRRGEMRGLRRSDVDLEHAQIRVGAQRQRDTLKPLKTDNGVRTVPIPPTLVAVLRRHFARQDALWSPAANQRDDRPVCVGWDGRLLSTDWLTRLPGWFAQQHGLRVIRLHDLRHTYATLLLEAGVSMAAVSRYLGHANVAITIAMYGHVTPRSERDSRAALEAAFTAHDVDGEQLVPGFVPASGPRLAIHAQFG